MIRGLNLAGTYLQQHATGKRSTDSALHNLNDQFFEPLEKVIRTEHYHNGWFTEAFIRQSFSETARLLTSERLGEWMDRYPALPVGSGREKKVGVIMAGNIPLVGFHDLLSVLASGHHFIGKLSSKDDRLLPSVAGIFKYILPGLNERLIFTDEFLKNVDAVIATGSDNSSRYFEYYFRHLPHIIRKNRNGIALLTGAETDQHLMDLGKDIFSYFGLGCRNVTKLYIPEGFELKRILQLYERFDYLLDNNKYCNNLDYYRSIFLMNRIPFLDNRIVLLKEDKQIASPVGVVYFEKYSQLDSVLETINMHRDEVQCLVTLQDTIEGSVYPGQSQSPELTDYADGVDTMKFLTEL